MASKSKPSKEQASKQLQQVIQLYNTKINPALVA
jgi:hypothetical protein